jgi:hypothetical protein
MRGMPGFFGKRSVIVAAVALVLAAAAGAAAGLTLTLTSSPSHVASLGLDGRASATFKITTGTPVLDVSVAHLTGTLLRVSTPDDATVRPVLNGSAPIVLTLVHAAGRDASYPVKVVLNSAVTWRLDFAGGTQRTEADLRGGKVGQIAITAGCDILDVTLPRPAGTLRPTCRSTARVGPGSPAGRCSPRPAGPPPHRGSASTPRPASPG